MTSRIPRQPLPLVILFTGLLLALVAGAFPVDGRAATRSPSAVAAERAPDAKAAKRTTAAQRATAKRRAAARKRAKARKQPKQCRALSKARARKVVRSRRTSKLRDGTRRTRTVYCDGSTRTRDVKPGTTKTVDRPVPGPTVTVPGPTVQVPGPTVTVPGDPVPVPEPAKALRLTLFHNNDGESKLKTGDSVLDYGGVGRFANRLGQLRETARGYRDAEIDAGTKEQADLLVSSGDNLLAGLSLLTGMSRSGPWPDAIAASRLGYDAMTIGNHEFDFGEDRLAEYIEGVDQGVPFVSANLAFDAATPRLRRLAEIGRVRPSVVIRRGTQRIGVIGLTPPDLAGVSSPGNVTVDQDLAGVVNREVDALEAQGVNKIIVSAHLQGRDADFALIPQVKGVDVWIAGGGDDLFADPDDTLIPGDAAVESYPLAVRDAAGQSVEVVSTSGEYKYVGALTVEFDGEGRLTTVDRAASGPVRVSGAAGDPDAVPASPVFDADVTDPVDAFTAEQAAQVIGTQQADLKRQTGGTANDPIRRREASLGNLTADAFLFAGQRAKPSATRMVAFSNGGGIRADLLTTDANGADVSKADSFSVLPFFNQTGLVESVPCASLKALLEHAYARLPAIDGRFLQIAGMRVAIDPARTAQLPADDGDAPIATPGERVTDVDLVGPDGAYGTADDVAIVDGGAVVAGCAPIDVVTTNFTAANGDNFPFGALGLTTFTSIGQFYNETLDAFVTAPTTDGGLGGTISSAAYPAVAPPTRIVIAGD